MSTHSSAAGGQEHSLSAESEGFASDSAESTRPCTHEVALKLNELRRLQREFSKTAGIATMYLIVGALAGLQSAFCALQSVCAADPEIR